MTSGLTCYLSILSVLSAMMVRVVGHRARRDTSEAVMECRIELIFIPVTDVDRAIDFYVNKVGFTLDMQARVDENTRFVQVTPPTSACSIAFGEGITDMTPGTQNSIQVVVPVAEAARRELLERGVDAPEVQTLAWGSFTSFTDPDGNTWTLQQLPPPGSYDAPQA
jgi:catechol 2,3-dioxygenase-like lactoylglutathione lyase family enzyme